MHLIKPLTLNKKTFPVNIIQGPLAGYTCAPFRALTWKYSKPAFSCTEMISCKALLNNSNLSQYRYIAKDPDEGPVCFQLFGGNPKELGEATKIITDHGADLIDLNCGCPVKKVHKQSAGSSILLDPIRLYQMIRAMKDNTHLPISIKIRVQGSGNDIFNEEIAKVVNESGLDFLVVHGRHWMESYDILCNHDEIRFFVEQVKVPVIGNGDINSLESLEKMFATGCAGAMVGRAGIGQPWLIGSLIAAATQQEFLLPSSKEIGAIFIEHAERLAKMLNNERFAVLHARKLAKHYGRGLPEKKVFSIAMNSCQDLINFKAICQHYFGIP